MAKITFSEEIYLRALTGKVVAEHILDDYTKIAIISINNTICAAISAATEAVFVSLTEGRAAHFFVDDSNVDQVIQQVIEFNPDGVVLMFGGETPIEETKNLFVKTMHAIAVKNPEFDVILHVRIFAAGGLQEALKDEAVEIYAEENEMGVYTVDLDNSLLIFSSIHVDDDDYDDIIYLEKILEIPVTAEHADLLNRSLRNKTIAWVDA
ncbi:hypothetical protein DRI50_03600 [candidate division KSB1 bacterium]|nr:MAG: hypothetical protein DRI50_03600 [candidate division KSB1 bacterium]